MAASSGRPDAAPLPEWAGLTEPTTVITNVVLGLIAMWLSAREEARTPHTAASETPPTPG